MTGLTIVDVINAGAVKPPLAKDCPFCGSEPALATKTYGGKYVVSCDADDCPANPQVSDEIAARAWAKWNGGTM